MYPEDKEGASLADAASSLWGGVGAQASESIISRIDETRFSADPFAESPQKQAPEIEDSLTGTARRNAEGGLMPFDMDVPVAYGSVTGVNMKNIQLGITDITSGTVVSTTGMGMVEEGDPVSVDVRDSTSLMENIETQRVPCPRLCGATFGSGNGGLVVFHNGEVKKMWNWYQRTDTIRISGIPGGKGDTIHSDPESLRMVHDTSSTTAAHVETSGKPTQQAARSGPRTLKELMSMMTTAKEVSITSPFLRICEIMP